MKVMVDKTGHIVLHEESDFSSFKLVADRALGDAQQLAEAMAAAGLRFDGTHGWIGEGWLRARLPSDEWAQAGFDRMIDFARTRGWVDTGSGDVRAHLEWSDR
jgi:hypothetical protein